MNLLHKKFENFYKKFSSPVHKNSNKRHTSTLPDSIYQCYETPIDSRTKPDFQSLHLLTFQPNNKDAHVEFLFHKTLLKKILTIRKFQKNFFLIFQALAFNTFFCLINSTAVSTHQEGGSPIPRNVDPMAFHLIVLEVDDILPSPLTPLVLAPTVPKPVCEMQTPAFFTMAQPSPHPKFVDTANYARVNPMPSSATSSSSSDELHLYFDSDTSSPSVPVGPQNSSQGLLLQRDNQVQQPPRLFSIAHTAVSTPQTPPQPTSCPFWADEVAIAQQSGHSTPETVIPNWTYLGRIRAHDHGRSHWYTHQRLCPHLTTNAHPYLHRGTAQLYHLSGRNSLSFNHPPTINPGRQTTTRRQITTSSRGGGNPFVPTQGIPHRSQGPNFCFYEFTNPPRHQYLTSYTYAREDQ